MGICKPICRWGVTHTRHSTCTSNLFYGCLSYMCVCLCWQVSVCVCAHSCVGQLFHRIIYSLSMANLLLTHTYSSRYCSQKWMMWLHHDSSHKSSSSIMTWTSPAFPNGSIFSSDMRFLAFNAPILDPSTAPASLCSHRAFEWDHVGFNEESAVTVSSIV